ncbi:ABC transporter ATP-binding protein [Gemmata sp. JC673]|uniref:ABC transporter ATP-binding protein n=1 Tax=Gemmata algarum TaxID=2975278 RepID=A0ABU5F0M6_9BACT|nr:ABC transporter ATP-binding protein [Gemmata algarum]MDY3561126.1 ABC transporter ATP-binding protein [Gemmata algarum]
MGEPVLEIANLRKRYGDLVALDGVSLTVRKGEVFGLLGPNGAGKTTLLSIAAGLARSDSGRVELFGSVFTHDSRDLRHLVGIGTQDLAIYPDLTARENLRFFGKLYGLAGRHLTARVDTVLAAVGLTDRAGDRAGTFSGGMKRRLNLAVAVVHDPKLLILDEPTTGVDPQSRNHIFEQVKALNAAGLTVIYTSHYMEEVQALCNRIAIIDAGRLRASDTLPNLLKRLDATIHMTVAGAAADFAQVLGAIPGVKRVGEGAPPTSPKKGAEGNPPPGPLPEGRGSSLDSLSELDSQSGSEGSLLPLPSGRGPGGGLPSAPLPTVGNGSTFVLVVDEIGPVLARVASECAARGAALLSAATTEPTLERVFLHLTGRGLRD